MIFRACLVTWYGDICSSLLTSKALVTNEGRGIVGVEILWLLWDYHWLLFNAQLFVTPTTKISWLDYGANIGIKASIDSLARLSLFVMCLLCPVHLDYRVILSRLIPHLIQEYNITTITASYTHSTLFFILVWRVWSRRLIYGQFLQTRHENDQ